MSKKILTMLFILVSAVFLVSCKPKEDAGPIKMESIPKEEVDPIKMESIPQLNLPKKGDTIATLKTDKGDIKILLLKNEAPKAVENFVTHANNNYYDGVLFHRVINDFMIQSGDPEGTGKGGESIFGEPFEDEFSPKALHIRGALSMANRGENTNASQFFIVQNNTLEEKYISKMENMLNDMENPEVKDFMTTRYPEAIMRRYLENGGNPNLDFGYVVFGQVLDGMDIVDEIAKVKVDEASKPLEDVKIQDIVIETFK